MQCLWLLPSGVVRATPLKILMESPTPAAQRAREVVELHEREHVHVELQDGLDQAPAPRLPREARAVPRLDLEV